MVSMFNGFNLLESNKFNLLTVAAYDPGEEGQP